MKTEAFDFALQQYVKLGIQVGVNIQKGQTLCIQADIGAAPVVRQAVRMAYEAGARHVHVEWTDDELRRIRYEHASLTSFADDAAMAAQRYEHFVNQDGAMLALTTTHPDLLTGIDPQKIGESTKLYGIAMKTFRDAIMTDRISWSVLAVPSEVWAVKVFPHSAPREALLLLWDAIFRATRADQKDPVAAWGAHLETLQTHQQRLNAKRYAALHYVAPGTDLHVALADDHEWVTGGSTNVHGVSFVANMPTEEVFTMPKRGGVHGTVRSTKPLYYNGTLIEDFTLTFAEGKVVAHTATKGKETLDALLNQDEGARYLGEVALVPHRSPISNTGLVFYNTLFDENASHHLALGNAYAFCVRGGKTMDKSQRAAKGANESIVHVDFMVGSALMDVDGVTADGHVEPLFRQGEWVI